MSYSATSRTGALGRRSSNHNVFLKTIDFQFRSELTEDAFHFNSKVPCFLIDLVQTFQAHLVYQLFRKI